MLAGLDLTNIIGLVELVIILVIVVFAARLFRKKGGRIAFGKLSAAFGDPGAWSFMIEILRTVVKNNRALLDLRTRQRKIVDDAILQWRTTMGVMLQEEFEHRGEHQTDLIAIPEFVDLGMSFEFTKYELKRKIMGDIETNGYERFIDEAERNLYVMDKIEDLHQVVRASVMKYYRGCTADSTGCSDEPVTTILVSQWITERRHLVEKTFHEMYLAIIRDTLRVKDAVLNQAKIAVRKALDLGCPESQSEYLLRILTDEALEVL